MFGEVEAGGSCLVRFLYGLQMIVELSQICYFSIAFLISFAPTSSRVVLLFLLPSLSHHPVEPCGYAEHRYGARALVMGRSRDSFSACWSTRNSRALVWLEPRQRLCRIDSPFAVLEMELEQRHHLSDDAVGNVVDFDATDSIRMRVIDVDDILERGVLCRPIRIGLIHLLNSLDIVLQRLDAL